MKQFFGLLKGWYADRRALERGRLIYPLFPTWADLLDAGLPITESVTVMTAFKWPKPARMALQSVQASIEDGNSVFSTLNRHFPIQIRLVLAAGEETGRLSWSLRQAHQWISWQREWARQVISTAAYPAFLMLTCCLVCLFLSRILMPQFIQMYREFGSVLTPQAVVLIRILRWIPIVVGTTVFLLVMWTSWPWLDSRFRLTQLTLHHHPIGRWLILWRTGVFCAILSVGLQAGIPVASLLENLSEPSSPGWMRLICRTAHGRLLEGETLSRIFEGDWAPVMHFMIATAEQTGELSESLEKTKEYCQHRLTYSIQRSLRVATPVLTMVVGGLTSVTMAGLYVPLYSLISSIGGLGHG